MSDQPPLPYGDEELNGVAEQATEAPITPDRSGDQDPDTVSETAAAVPPGVLQVAPDQENATTEVRLENPASRWEASEEEFATNLLALGRVRGVGVKTLRVLLDTYVDLRQVWDSDPDRLREVLHKAKTPDINSIVAVITNQRSRLLKDSAQQLERLRKNGVRLIRDDMPDFPDQLREIPDRPYWLFIQGNVDALHEPLVAIVGTRTPSPIGVQTAQRLAGVVSREGLGIVSGLAEGIDDAAHRAGLFYGAPQVAVLGTGIDVAPFPASTAQTRRLLIKSGGAIVSGYLPDDMYSRSRFVERNRIQAGLCVALAPVESRSQSGTAHTVRFAERYNRPVFGVYRGKPDFGNEMLRLLAERGCPLFNLDGEVQHLVVWLKETLSLDPWPQQRRPRPELYLNEILSLLDTVQATIPLSLEDGRWLQQQIARRLNLPLSASTETKDER